MVPALHFLAGWMPRLRGPQRRGSREILLIVAAALALYVGLSLFTYHPGDPSWSHSGQVQSIANRGGVVGAWLADILFHLFGFMAYLSPFMLAHAGWLTVRGRSPRPDAADEVHWIARFAGGIATLSAGCAMAALHYQGATSLPLDGGGIVGHLLGGKLAGAFSPLGATVFLLALFLVGFTLFTGLSWLTIMDATGRFTLNGLRRLFRVARLCTDFVVEGRRARRERAAQRSPDKVRRGRRSAPRIESPPRRTASGPRAVKERREPRIEPPKPPVEAREPPMEAREAPVEPASGERSLPSLSLLDEPQRSGHAMSESALQEMSRQVELKLADFGVAAEVTEVLPGPVVTRFELQLAPGIKVSKVTALSKDLARSLSTVSVRVVEVIPGKSVIGLEIPNEQRELVSLSEVLSSSACSSAKAALALALGKDISGEPVVVDLARMPHLLVAGTTGAGKSVAINAMVLSLLYRAGPCEVRMIMIDPKMLELSVYEGIPHLLAPVVTDMKEAANALRWCVIEMERRYRLMSALGVRNVGGFNRKLEDARARGERLVDPLHDGGDEEGGDAPALEPLSMIVVVIDELADLMMVTGKKVEELIARLAQKARASGIHLILATQRPSVDVITGLIKANIPSRIAFQVSSKVDSRTIIDQMGAESLLGHGDMLYMAPGMATLRRVHGAFVGDQEVHRVVRALKKQGRPRYVSEILEGGSTENAGLSSASVPALESDPESDPYYDEAVRIVTETRRASISGVQRRLKVGYNRAARMLEQMEQAGVVGALQANGSREVYAPPPPEA